jgi:hypothetical protein
MKVPPAPYGRAAEFHSLGEQLKDDRAYGRAWRDRALSVAGRPLAVSNAARE